MIVETIGSHHLKIFAPAKLNLFLEVLGKRSDGYHDLCTIMHTVDLYDVLEIRLARDCRFQGKGRDMGPDEHNLACKAMRLFLQKLDQDLCFHIELDKRIPVGGGLGGGSSDCAAILIGCNELAGRPFTRDQLCTMGAELGSDIPFFFFCGTAQCTGRGEVVKSIPNVPEMHFLLIYPGFPVLTRRVYQNLNLGLTDFKKQSTLLDVILASNKLNVLKEHFFNRLEPSVFETEAQMRTVGASLRNAGFKSIRVTGSGSTFFQVFEKEEIREAETKLYHLDDSWEWFLVKSSPTFHL